MSPLLQFDTFFVDSFLNCGIGKRFSVIFIFLRRAFAWFLRVLVFIACVDAITEH